MKNNSRIHHILIKMYIKAFAIVNRAGCHQRADRSFFIKHYQFPMCARCTGVFFGYLLAVPMYFIHTFSLSFYTVLCAIMFLDWLIQFARIKESTNLRRFVTGIMGSFGMLSFALTVFNYGIFWLKSI